MTQTMNLTARPQGSRVLGAWLSEREGAAERAGIVALGENSTGSLNLSELTAMIGASSVSAYADTEDAPIMAVNSLKFRLPVLFSPSATMPARSAAPSRSDSHAPRTRLPCGLAVKFMVWVMSKCLVK